MQYKSIVIDLTGPIKNTQEEIDKNLKDIKSEIISSHIHNDRLIVLYQKKDAQDFA